MLYSTKRLLDEMGLDEMGLDEMSWNRYKFCSVYIYTELIGLSSSIKRQISLSESQKNDWLVSCFGFNGLLRQFFSLYRAASQRDGERTKKYQQ